MGTPTTVPNDNLDTEISVQDRLNGATGEELSAWRSKGDLPPTESERKVSAEKAASQTAEKDEKKTEATESETKDDASAHVEKKTKPATASDSATDKPQKGKTSRTDERFEELFGYLRQERERAQKLEEELASLRGEKKPAEQKAESQTAAETKKPVRPKMDDKNEAGEFKYKTLGEFDDAVAKYEDERDAWRDEQAKKSRTDEDTKTQKARELAEAEKVVIEKFSERVKESAKKHSDWKEVAQNPKLPIFKGSPIESFIFDSDQGAEIAYYLGSNPEVLTEMTGLKATTKNADGTYNFERVGNPMTPAQIFRKLTHIELTLSPDEEKKSEPAAKKEPVVLPKPVTEVSARRSASRDDAEAALESKNVAEYMRIQNERDARKFRASRGA